jgi:hypothetical protein
MQPLRTFIALLNIFQLLTRNQKYARNIISEHAVCVCYFSLEDPIFSLLRTHNHLGPRQAAREIHAPGFLQKRYRRQTSLRQFTAADR